MTSNYPAFAIAGAVLTIGVASAPDKLTWRFVPHGWTHSLLGGAIIGGVLAAAGWWIASNIVIYAGGAIVLPVVGAEYGLTIGILAVYGHVVGDFLTGTDVRLLWPVANYEFSINLPRLLDPRDNEGINLFGTMVLVCVIVALASSGVTAAAVP